MNTDKKDLISVIVPVYNVGEYVESCISSICNQSYKKIELILVDDGSTDNSLQVCKKKEEIDKRIKVLSSNHGGVSVARNLGLSRAQGEYILFIDADDYVEKDMLEYLYGRISKANADVATCEFDKVYPDGKHMMSGKHKDYEIKGKQVIEEINYGGEFTPFLFNKLFKKNILEGICFQEGVSLGEDYGFIMQVMLKHPLIVRGSECKYHYRQRSTSVSYQGFVSYDRAKKNRENYKDTYELLVKADIQLEKSALAYYILQEMAVVISMVKSGRKEKRLLKEIQKVVRKNLWSYLRISRVPFYLKCCAILFSIHENLLSMPYKIIFHRMRSVE